MKSSPEDLFTLCQYAKSIPALSQARITFVPLGLPPRRASTSSRLIALHVVLALAGPALVCAGEVGGKASLRSKRKKWPAASLRGIPFPSSRLRVVDGGSVGNVRRPRRWRSHSSSRTEAKGSFIAADIKVAEPALIEARFFNRRLLWIALKK